jgi:hypothetical protein
MGCCWSQKDGDGNGNDIAPVSEKTALLDGQRRAAEASKGVVASNAEAEKTPVPNKSIEERAQPAITAAKLTGQALLEMAQQVPILAPVAFLVGAVASSCQDAVVLKGDVSEFENVIKMLEGILLKAESIENHDGEVAEVRDALTDALQLMERMKSAGALKHFWTANSQRSKFEEIKERIHNALERIKLQSSIDTNMIARVKFKQSEGLKQCIEDLGGVDAVIDDPSKMEEVTRHMEASDKIIHAAVKKTSHHIKQVGEHVVDTQRVVKRLEVMQSHESELQRMRNEVLEQQVKELKAMVSDVRNCMKLFPVPAKEPERMVVMSQGNFLHISPSDDAFEELQRVTKEASLRWGLAAFVNMVGGKKQFTAAGFMPQFVTKREEQSPKSKTTGDQLNLISDDKLAVDLCGLVIPRKMTNCQHVVHDEKPLVYEGLKAARVEFAKPEELQVASTVDPVLADFLESMANNPSMLANEHGSVGREKAMEIASEYLQMSNSSPESVFYAGVPVTVGGVVVASFCLFGPRAPDKGFGDTDLAEMEEMSERASKALQRQLDKNRIQERLQ